MFKKIRFWAGGGWLASIIMVILGLILLIWPGRTLELAARVIGIGLLLVGAVCGISWYINRHSVRGSAMRMGQAILGLGAGLFVLLSPRLIVGLLPTIVGLLILLNGVVNLTQALSLKSAGGMAWKGPLVLAGLTLLLGLVIVLNPFSAAAMTVAAIGAVLVYNGISNLIISSRYRKI